MIKGRTSAYLLLFALLLLTILIGITNLTKEPNFVSSSEENLSYFIEMAVSSKLIEKDEALYLLSLLSKSEEIISSGHPLADDLAAILNKFEKMAKTKGLSKIDLFILEKTVEVNLKYINSSQKEPVLFERFFDTSLSFPFVYIEGQGFNFHPTNALNYATELFEYKKNLRGFLEVMRDMLLFVEDKNIGDLEYGVFKFYFAWENEDIPWISSISQGIGCAYFAIAYSITGEYEFKRAAILLANSFQVPFEKGGFRAELDFGPFYLEYSNAPYDLVLNGFMLSLKGLWIYSQLIEDSAALNTFYSGINTLELLLPKYDLGYWSAYSLLSDQNSRTHQQYYNTRIASERYHRLHIRLLYFLAKASESTILEKYVEEWDGYLVEGGFKSEIQRAKEEYDFWISVTSG